MSNSESSNSNSVETPETAVPSVSDAVAAAARKAGIGKVLPGEVPTGTALLAAIGGVRGIVESILPGLVFLVIFTATQSLIPSVLIPVGVAMVFVVARLVSKTPVASAVSGLIGIGASALLALISGRAADNFVLGFYINGVWILALATSLLIRWPFIGVIVGLLRSEGTGWRQNKAKFRVATVTTILWLSLFSARLLVQLPLFFANETQWLAASKLLMGLPLYAAVLWVTWLLVKAVYSPRKPTEAPGDSPS
jgi:hypothetical protein